MKKLVWIVVALVLLVVFPSLAETVTEIAAGIAVWASGDRLLVGLVFGLIAVPHLQNSLHRLKH